MLYSIENLILTRPQRSGYRLRIKSLEIAPGETAAITGPSGCGKSTALDLLGMVLRPDSAARFIFNPGGAAEGAQEQDLLEAWQKDRLDHMAALRRDHIGYVLQTGGLLPFVSVGENMAVPARLRGMPENEIKDMVAELAGRLDIAGLLNEPPNSLSVGERQRAAIGRALASRPGVVLADEPTAALDPLRAGDVMEIFVKAARVFKATLIIVTHDARIVSGFGLREIPVAVATGPDGFTEAVIDAGPPPHMQGAAQ